MLIGFVVAYLIISIAIGLWAARKVHNTADFMTTGRQLPVIVVIAVVFATWFGAETVLGIPGEFMDSNLGGLISDPFGAALCLILFGLFFARKLYRMNLLTIGDFYRQRFDRRVEVVTGIAIVLSYLGWVAAQIMALGLVFNVLSDGAISERHGILIGAAIVMIYTVVGGMWSVAMTTFFQMIVILLGLAYVGWQVSDITGGVLPVIEHAVEADKFQFWPELNTIAMLAFLSGLLTLGFGSIPQQDVFQRANSARNENAAVCGTVIGGVLYLLFAAVPLFIAYSANLIDPAIIARFLDDDPQKILPELIKTHLPLFTQVVFYGSLLAVIMSTAAGTLLAPSVIISENLLKGVVKRELSDRQLLTMTRWVVAGFTVAVTLYTLNASAMGTRIHTMVEDAYKVTLVIAFTPLVFGLYWSKATVRGAYWAIGFGLAVWLPLEWLLKDPAISPHFYGFFASIAGMLLGSLWPRKPLTATAQ